MDLLVVDLVEQFYAPTVIPGFLTEGQQLFNTYVVLVELEERCVGSNLGHRPGSIEEF
jgi:hypothetical protein